MELNKLAKEIYEANKAKGFWDEKREIGTLLMLVTSELAEALEADRKNDYADTTSYNNVVDDSNSFLSYKSYEDSRISNFEYHIKDKFQDEICDAIIRLLDMCGGLGIDIDFHVREKLWYNSTRDHKHGKKY